MSTANNHPSTLNTYQSPTEAGGVVASPDQLQSEINQAASQLPDANQKKTSTSINTTSKNPPISYPQPPKVHTQNNQSPSYFSKTAPSSETNPTQKLTNQDIQHIQEEPKINTQEQSSSQLFSYIIIGVLVLGIFIGLFFLLSIII